MVEDTIKPERFGRYILLDKLGEGGMAEVFRAVMPGVEGFRRTFVIKRILAAHCKRPEFVEMFIREAHIASTLHHPNIVQVYDFGSVDGIYFLAMEYLSGRDVLTIIRRLREVKRPFPIPIVAFIGQQIANGLGYAHSLCDVDGKPLDIIHRDVSPSNAMCLREGGVKLLDFGIAKSIDDNAPEPTEQGSVKGKIAYVAPERVRGEPFDGRSDLYSLGVILWEMLTCKRLFRGANDVETWHKVVEMKVDPPSSVRPDIPPSLDAIVMRALERNPSVRFANGHVMSDALEEVVAETKFQSRMLPRLLVDLFGSGRQSNQLAFSNLTPDILAAMEPSQISGVSPDLHTGTVTRFYSMLSPKGWLAVGAGTVLAAGGIVAALALGNGKRHDSTVSGGGSYASETRVEQPTARPIVPTQDAEVADSESELPQVVSPEKDKPTTKAKPVVPPRRQGAPAARKNRISNGLSIDPFAEAAKRGGK